MKKRTGSLLGAPCGVCARPGGIRERKDEKKPGDALLSHGQAAVPSAKRRFTFVFGMGTSGSHLSLVTRKTNRKRRILHVHWSCSGNGNGNMVKPHGLLVLVG